MKTVVAKIKVEKPLVVLHGDEMAQVAFERILEQFVRARLDIDLVEIDISAKQRYTSNGEVVRDAIEALKTYGVGIKNAGMTVNRSQLDDLLAQHPEISEDSLDKLATKSPNGAIRKGISGNITREDIEFRNLKSVRPDWIDRDIEVDTMETGGLDFSYSELSDATGVEVWAKDETSNVAGSHKARHLVGVLLHMLVAERLGLSTGRAPLAISSCGNAALAAATLASRVRWPITVFVPTWMDEAFGDGLDRLGADVRRCARHDGDPPGDPAMAAFRRAIADGAVPFSVQGPHNGWCLDTGRTIGWEMRAQADATGVDLERVYVQVGGGAFATCCSDGFGDTPALQAVQTAGCAPLAAAVAAVGDDTNPGARWAEVMRPWDAPHSLADGILDDETYDWLGIVARLRASGGRTVIADEATVVAAHRMVNDGGDAVSPTGTAGVAGLLSDLAAGDRPDAAVAVVFSGVAR